MYERNELLGYGGGHELIVTRKRYLLNANGYSFIGTNQEKTQV